MIHLNEVPKISLTNLLGRKDVVRHIYINGLRYHHTTYGALPGVTTVLGETKDKYTKRALGDWSKRVGAVEAKRLQQAGLDRGNRIHSLIEGYVLGEDPWDIELALSPQYLGLSELFFEFVQARVGNPIYLEKSFASTDGYAGSPDFVGYDNKGKIALYDWKTSGKKKTKSQVKDYFVQVATYWAMVEQESSVKIDYASVVLGYSDPEKGDKMNEWRITKDDQVVLYAQFLDRLEKFNDLHNPTF